MAVIVSHVLIGIHSSAVQGETCRGTAWLFVVRASARPGARSFDKLRAGRLTTGVEVF